MTDLSYVRVAELNDPDRPWRRVWKCPATGFFVKTYAKRLNAGRFGTITWRITGSLCDENGDTVHDENGTPLVHEEAHLFKVASDARVGSESPPSFADMAKKMAVDLEANERLVICRVEEAELKRRAAAAL